MTQKQCRLLLAVTLLFAAWGGCTAPEQPREVMSIASSTLADLTTGAVTRACSRIYEPSDWVPNRIAEDHKQLSDIVEAVMKEVGTISSARIMHTWLIYELQLTGADARYWQALPDLGIATRVTYAVNFSKIGPGILSFTFTHLSGKWELRSISFGVETSVPNARDTALRLGRVILVTVTPGIAADQLDRSAEQMIGQERH
jgi:hypothetical protein